MNKVVEEMFRDTKRVVRRTVEPDSQWRQITEFPDFWVNQHNQIFNMRLCKLSALFRNNKGVLCVRIYRRGTHFNRSVDKLRRDAFDIPKVETIFYYRIPMTTPVGQRFMCATCGESVWTSNVYLHAEVAHKAKNVELLSSGAGIKEFVHV